MITSLRYRQSGQAGLSPTNPVHNAKLTFSGGVLELSKINMAADQQFYFKDGSVHTLSTAASYTASDTTGMECGTTAGVAWGNARPKYFYYTKDASDNVYIFWSFDPTKSSTPTTAAEIGYKSNPSTNNEDTDIFVWTSTNVTTTLQSKECTLLGSYTATKDSSDVWTPSTITAFDGVGRFQLGRAFGFPTGQMGAASGKLMLDNGGTAPVFTQQGRYEYKIGLDGLVRISFELNGDGGIDGSGAVTARVALPYKASFVDANMAPHGVIYTSSAGVLDGIWLTRIIDGWSWFDGLRQTSVSATTNIFNSDFPNGSRIIAGDYTFPAFRT